MRGLHAAGAVLADLQTIKDCKLLEHGQSTRNRRGSGADATAKGLDTERRTLTDLVGREILRCDVARIRPCRHGSGNLPGESGP